MIFLFVKSENNNFINEIKWEFSSRWKLLTAAQVFTDLLLSSTKHLPQFSTGYEGTKKMFYFFNEGN